MKFLYANIALPVPLAQTFTYIITNDFENELTIGSIVSVAFGKKILTGVVIEYTNNRPSVALKPIRTLEPIPPLSEKTISLALWIAEYYSAPIGETVRLFLPAGIGAISKRIIRLQKNIPADVIEAQEQISPQRKKIISLLRQNEITIQQLQKATGVKNLYALTNDLRNSGIVEIVEQSKKKIRTKKEWYFRRESGVPDVLLRKTQLRLWQIIETIEGEVSVTTFLKSHGGSLSIIKMLAQKKFISLYQKEVEYKNTLEIDDHTAKGLSILLNTHQQQAFHSIADVLEKNIHSTFLLHGITGSGKTQVYIESIRRALAMEKTAIVLVPEISLTPQTVKRFQLHFGDAVVWMHSKMSDSERSNAWHKAQSGSYKIVIGPRSALFAPLKNLGLIVVDEEHESSYKQFDSTPRYNARDVAIIRGILENAVVVLGSATPSMESFTNSSTGKFTLLSLPERADNAALPPVHIVNMNIERKKNFAAAKQTAKEIGKKAFENLSTSISSLLKEKIENRLEKKEGIILLQNRRGFAPFLECDECGHVEQCPRCSVTMTYHATKKHLRCHYCGKVQPPPATCSVCGGISIHMRGFGTQRVEQELTAFFPNAIILRMDLDTTTRKGSHEKLLREFGEGNADILLGTQMVAKGLDFPRVTLVGVISADTQMMLPDFRSAERTFQLLTQVAGRAGRSALAGEVIIQTSQPAHYSLRHVQDHDFNGFFNEELEFRRATSYPPYSRISLLEFRAKNEKKVEEVASTFGKLLRGYIPAEWILGPAAAALEKIKNEFRRQIIIKADKTKDKSGALARNAIKKAIQQISSHSKKNRVKIIVDVDPAGIL